MSKRMQSLCVVVCLVTCFSYATAQNVVKKGPNLVEVTVSGMGMDKDVALITDGCFSGGSRGAAIGHVSPEAAARGPIAAIEEGDTIKIDIANYRLDVELSDDEIARRLAGLSEFEPKAVSGYLRRYSEKVSSASTGAVFS